MNTLKQSRRKWEAEYIRQALERNKFNQTKTADELGIHRNSLLWKIKLFD